jgi:hypothetical protein
MSFLDFDAIKQRVSLEDAMKMLGLVMKPSNNQFRGPCPTCKDGGPRTLVITPGKGFYCFTAKAGGDQIALVAHIKGVSAKEAAQFLAGDSPRGTVPESESGSETKKLAPLPYLEHEHPAIDAVGFAPEFCKAHGIGYAGKGLMRGYVAIPFRDEHGTLLGYVGVQDAKLPPDFTPNVVAFKKSA